MTKLVLWLNGTFGVGKTTTATALARLRTDLRIFDPEEVGFMLRSNLTDHPVEDFQDWPAWRALVAVTAVELILQTGHGLITPQTVLTELYWQELTDRLSENDVTVFHVLLDADESALRQRITTSAEALEWRLDHIPRYVTARAEWLADRADLVLDMSQLRPEDAARTIAEAAARRDLLPK
jgi:predicted kinase